MASRRSAKWRHKGSRNYDEKDNGPNLHRHRRTKIVATVGPASSSPEMLEKLIKAGVNVFRMNFSHGTHETHAEVYQNIRTISHRLSRHVGILADLQGPKFRMGRVEGGAFDLTRGQVIKFTTSERLDLGTAECLATGTAHADVCIRFLKPGQRLMINDGLVVLEMLKRIDADTIECVVQVGGEVSDRKGINVPDLQVPMPALTPKDTKDAIYALKLGVDWMALSFVQRPSDVTELRDILRRNLRDDQWLPKIISKIEKPQALDVIDDIIAVSDGIMVARGDLGVECSLEKVPRYQKMLIEKCSKALKPVITATQMLESMTQNPFPTRSEVSDVANAVHDGSDAVMLSAESATGKYPVETVTMMANICVEAERTPHWFPVMPPPSTLDNFNMAEAVALTAVNAVKSVTRAKAVIAVVVSTNFAQVLSKFRPRVPVICICFTTKMATILELYFGLLPLLIEDPFMDDEEEDLITSDDFIALVEAEVARSADFPWLDHGDVIVLASGESRLPSLVNSINFHEFGTAQRNLSARRWQRLAAGQRMALQRRVSAGLERRRSGVDEEDAIRATLDGSQTDSVPSTPRRNSVGPAFNPEPPAELSDVEVSIPEDDPELQKLLEEEQRCRRPVGSAAEQAALELEAAEKEYVNDQLKHHKK